MASSVFFRFKSSKEPTRVSFDGTGISVFELKRDIITSSRLGDGTDFELVLYSDDSNEVYDDDTTIIPRSTTVIAKRLPAAKPGRGGAARYVSGKMPVNAKNTHRSEAMAPRTNGRGLNRQSPNTVSNVSELQTEEEREAAVLKMAAEQWEQQQQEMAGATRIHTHYGVPLKGKPINIPDHPPPPGYVCYRCGEKGHWIQVCPTNDDPTFDNKPRIKRTTGIPRSMLKIIEKPTALINDGTTDDTKQPSGVMVNADGDWVIAEPDKVAWEQYQARAKQSAAAQEKASLGDKELQDKGLECSLDKHLFIDPTKTPCCQTTYCHECITNALLDDDLQCPSCGREGILIDDLVSDTEMIAKIRSYEEQKVASVSQSLRKEGEKPTIKREASTQVLGDQRSSKSPTSVESPSSTGSTTGNDRKRRADTDLENNHAPPGPVGPGPSNATPSASVQSTSTSTPSTKSTSTSTGRSFPPELAFLNQPPFTNAGILPGMTSTVFPNPNPYMGMAMSLPPLMGFNPAMVNPMMMPNAFPMAVMGNPWNSMNGMFPQQGSGMYGSGNFQPGTMSNGQTSMNNTYAGGNSGNLSGRGMNNFTNQQRTNFSSNRPGAEDSAYFRQPVNPHRHQGRRNAPRPTDYREI
ncbi:hypothetical protein MMC13_006582 [Lambiella insularis]|nr:hypothetical protein [Lambiella insularis]